MCGIVGVVRRRSRREPPDGRALVAQLDAAVARAGLDAGALLDVAALVEAVDAALRGVPGVRALVHDPEAATGIDGAAGALQQRLLGIETDLDVGARVHRPVRPRGHQRRARALQGRRVGGPGRPAPDGTRGRRCSPATGASTAALEAFTSVQVALSALDRLEVRGRDSAGLHVLVHGHDLAPDTPELVAALADRAHDPLFGSRSVRVAGDGLAFVYKAAAEIGELGDNTATLRAAIATDDLLRAAVSGDTAEAVVLAHTRWASVGAISEANAHPLNQEEIGRDPRSLRRRPRSTATSTTTPTCSSSRISRCPPRSRPTPRSSPSSRRAGSRTVSSRSRRSGRPSRRSRARSRSPPAPPQRRSSSSSRCGGAARPSTSGSPRTPSSWRASRTVSSRRRRRTSAWTARRRPIPDRASATRGQVVVLDAAARRRARGDHARGLRRHAAAGRRR